MTVYTYEEYKNKVLNLLYQEYEPDIVKKINVPGSNGKNAEGVCLCFGTNSASPIIYFDSDKVSHSDEDVQTFVGKVRDEYCEFMKFLKEEPDDMSWKKMKRRIFPRVLNYDRNKETLENVPYMKYMDFAVCFFYNTKSESEHGAMTIGNEMQEIWNVTLEELFEASVENLKKLDCSMKNLDEVAAMCGLDVNEDKSVPLYTLSVYTGIFGAAVILNAGFLHPLCELLQCTKLWIIASSSHELLALPYDYAADAKRIYQMTMEIDKLIGSEDFLSDKLYVYNDENQQIEIAKEVDSNG